jgi:hypothetical protein
MVLPADTAAPVGVIVAVLVVVLGGVLVAILVVVSPVDPAALVGAIVGVLVGAIVGVLTAVSPADPAVLVGVLVAVLVVELDATAARSDGCCLVLLEVFVTGWTAPQAAAGSSRMGRRRRFFMKHTSSQRWVISPATGKS